MARLSRRLWQAGGAVKRAYRVLVTPATGAPGFVMQARNGADRYRPHDGAVMERPHAFAPFQTNNASEAARVARLARNDCSRAEVITWKGN